MRNCKYYLNIDGVSVTLNGDRELTDFIKENLKENPEGIKYSLSPQSKGEELVEILNTKPSQYIKETENTPYKFIEKQHLIEGQLSYLMPQFKSEKYKEILRLKLKNGNPNLSKEEIEYEVNDILKTNDATERFSIEFAKYFRSVLRLKINPLSGVSRDDQLKGIIKKILEYNYEIVNGPIPKESPITDEEIQKYLPRIKKEIDTLIEDIVSQDWYKLQVGQNISINNKLLNPDVEMNDAIHLLGVKEDGKTEIFEIKVSQDSYDHWDDTKKSKVDYILGIHRQLLSNYTDVYETKLRIIEMIITKKEVNGKRIFNLDSFTAVQNVERTEDDLDKVKYGEGVKPLNFMNGKITNRLRSLLPANMPVSSKISTGLVEKVNEQLETIFPKGSYEFKTKAGIDPDKLYTKILKDQAKLSEVSFIDYTSTHKTRVAVSKGESDWKEKFRKLLFEYAEKYNADKHSRSRSLITQVQNMKSRNTAQ